MGIRKSEFVTKTQFLLHFFVSERNLKKCEIFDKHFYFVKRFTLFSGDPTEHYAHISTCAVNT